MQEASVKLKIDGDCSSFNAAAAQAESAGRSSADVAAALAILRLPWRTEQVPPGPAVPEGTVRCDNRTGRAVIIRLRHSLDGAFAISRARRHRTPRDG